MTTLAEKKVSCALCGTVNAVTLIASTNTFGYPDLDTRPAPMKRHTMPHWVHQCAGCGYCAADLAKATPRAKERMASREYQETLKDARLSPLARRFACLSMLHDGWSVFWISLQTSWACDDAKAPEPAARWRSKAFEILEAHRAKGEKLDGDPGMERVIRADLLRRTGRFGEVEAEVVAGLAENPQEVVIKVLEFERALAAKGDVEAHTVGEVVGEKPFVPRNPEPAHDVKAPRLLRRAFACPHCGAKTEEVKHAQPRYGGPILICLSCGRSSPETN